MGYRQQQRTPRTAGVTLQIILMPNGKPNNSSHYMQQIRLDDDWQLMKEVSLECFLLLSLCSTARLMYRMIPTLRINYIKPASATTCRAFTLNEFCYVTVIR
jgi:hypothetical protein